MNRSLLTILLSGLMLIAACPAIANNWQVVYQTDFSTDPGWITNEPSRYYWNSSEGTFFANQFNINGGGCYAYRNVAHRGEDSFRLEWDMIVNSIDYAAALSFGLYANDLQADAPPANYAQVILGSEDRGLVAFLAWANPTTYGGGSSAYFSLNTWYHIVMEYDAAAHTLKADVTVRDTGEHFATLSAANVGLFATDMGCLGSSNVRSGHFQCPGHQSFGKFDNVIFSALADGPQGDLKGRIAFVSPSEQKIYVMNADGSSRQQVPLPPLDIVHAPQWSRDGLWLTFSGGPGLNSQIYIVRPDGSGFRRVTNGSGDMVEPSFSPDGSQIAFCGSDGTALYIINTDGTGLRRLPVDGSFPEWWPLGDKILYSNWGRTYESDLFLYDCAAGQSIQITHHTPGQAFIRAAWSPNGRRLAVDFRDRNRTGDKRDILIMNADGSNPYNFTVAWPDSDEGAACWSPDGQFILFTSDRTGNLDIWYSPVDVFSPVNVTNSPKDEDMPAMGTIPEAHPVYHVDAVNGNDNNNGLSRRTAFATIAKGIDSATNRYKVLVYPGVYQEEIDFKGKAITIQGVATKAGIPIIENPGDFAVSFYNGEGPRSILKNFVVRNSFMGIFIAGSSPTIKNLNIVDNKYGIEAYAGSEPDVSNCIFWENSDSDLFGCEARYSWVHSAIEPQPGRGLVAYWNFDEGSGNIAHDSAGNNDGTIYGAQWTAGEIGNALNFDGENDYVEVPDNDALDPTSTQEITIAAWVNISTYVCPFHSACYFGIVSKTLTYDRDNGNYVFAIVTRFDPTYEGKLRFGIVYDGLHWHDVYSNSLVPKDRWVHVAVTHDVHQNTRFYIDGVLAGTDTSTITTDFANSTKALTIGHTNSYSDYFLGQIDEVCIYNRALSAQEIQQLSRGELTNSPLFADPANGDYHLLSQRGRYWPRPDVWVLDKVTSPCVDGGDPNDDPSDEPMPNGGRIDMGAFGGTPFASMSETKWLDGDINHDRIVNFIDLAMMAENWLRTGIGLELPANYNWLSYNGHHYALTLQYGVWEQAEAEAVSVGGHLVTINNQVENYWAVETINNIYTQGGLHNIAWIGLEYVSGDRSNPNSWRWVNGEAVTYWNPYSYGLDPAGNHMYLEGNSQIDPGGWCNGTAHETDPSKFPRGIIELPW
jgi:Tol biopolymer transport system component